MSQKTSNPVSALITPSNAKSLSKILKALISYGDKLVITASTHTLSIRATNLSLTAQGTVVLNRDFFEEYDWNEGRIIGPQVERVVAEEEFHVDGRAWLAKMSLSDVSLAVHGVRLRLWRPPVMPGKGSDIGHWLEIAYENQEAGSIIYRLPVEDSEPGMVWSASDIGQTLSFKVLFPFSGTTDLLAATTRLDHRPDAKLEFRTEESCLLIECYSGGWLFTVLSLNLCPDEEVKTADRVGTTSVIVRGEDCKIFQSPADSERSWLALREVRAAWSLASSTKRDLLWEFDNDCLLVVTISDEMPAATCRQAWYFEALLSTGKYAGGKRPAPSPHADSPAKRIRAVSENKENVSPHGLITRTGSQYRDTKPAKKPGNSIKLTSPAPENQLEERNLSPTPTPAPTPMNERHMMLEPVFGSAAWGPEQSGCIEEEFDEGSWST